MTPQLILTLSPSGQLVIERPMSGSLQQIPILPGQLEATAKRILLAQLANESHLGQDGLPTTAQVNHWNRHSLWTDPSCAFCQAESVQSTPTKTRPASCHSNRPIPVGNGSVTVRHVPPSKSDRKSLGLKLTSTLSTADLGL